MRYGEIFHEPKASEISRHTVQQTLRVQWGVFGVFVCFGFVFCELQVVAG